MNEQQIETLIEKAKQFSNNSFVPFSSVPQGACVLTDDDILIGGCSVENFDLSCSSSAVSVAVLKAVSEGKTNIKAVAVYSAGKNLPYLTGSDRQLVYQFGKGAEVIVANGEKWEKFSTFELLPFAFEGED